MTSQNFCNDLKNIVTQDNEAVLSREAIESNFGMRTMKFELRFFDILPVIKNSLTARAMMFQQE